MTILDKNTITLPNAQEMYPNLVDSVNEGLFYYTIPFTMAVIGVILVIGLILFITGIIKDRGRGSSLLVSYFYLMTFSFISFAVSSISMAILIDKLEKDTNILAEHVSQHSETEDKVTELANTTGFDYKDVCDTIVDNRESSLCGGELPDPINWGDKDDIYHIDPDYDYNNAEDELIVTFNLKKQ